MNERSPQLERENLIALMTVQALLGQISSKVIAIAVKVGTDKVVLQIWATVIDQEVESDAQDSLDELEALFLPENPFLESEFHLGPPPTNRPEWTGRMIYWAKD